MNDLNNYLNETSEQGFSDANAARPPRKRGRQSSNVMPDTRSYLAPMGASDYSENVNNNDYLDPNYSYDSPHDTNEIRATAQGAWDKAGKGLGRVAVKTLAEIVKMPGYIGGAVMAPFAEEGEGWDTLTNNAWIESINNANEHINDENLPVYVKKAVREGNLTDNIFSLDFWATEGADGVGYIASMMVPGAIINKVGLGSKLAKGLGLASKLSPDKANVIAATLGNTLMEASAEAGGAMENFQKDLDLKLRAGEISMEQYEALELQKAMLGRDIFLANAAILLGPNAMQSTLLYANKGRNSIDLFKGNKNLYNASTKAFELPQVTAKTKVANIAKDFLTGGLPEAWEELSQSAAETMYSEKALKGELNSDWLGMFKDTNLSEVTSSYIDTMMSVDGQKAMFLGFILGSPMTLVGNHKGRKNQRVQDEALVTKGNAAIEAFSNLHDYEGMYNEDGSLNYEKFLKKTTSLEVLNKMNDSMNSAIENNDKEEFRKLQDLSIRQLVHEFISNEEKGLASLEGFLEDSGKIQEIVDADNAVMGGETTFKEKKDSILKLAKETQEHRQNFLDFADVLMDPKLKDKFSKEDYNLFKHVALQSYLSKHLEVDSFKNEIDILKEKKKRLTKSLGSYENISTEVTELENLDSVDSELSLERRTQLKNSQQVQEIDRIIKELEDQYNESKKVLDNFWSEDQLEKEANFVQAYRESVNESLNEEKAEEMEAQIQTNNMSLQEQLEEIKNLSESEIQAAYQDKKYDLNNPAIENAITQRLNEITPLDPKLTGSLFDFIDNGGVPNETVTDNPHEITPPVDPVVEEMKEQRQAEVDEYFDTVEVGFEIDDSNTGLNGEVTAKDDISFTVNDVQYFKSDLEINASKTDAFLKSREKTPLIKLDDKPVTPGIGSAEYVEYLSNRKDKVGETVNFRLNKGVTANPNISAENLEKYGKAFDIYNKTLKTMKLSKEDREFLIENLPIEFMYSNGSTSFSGFPSNMPSVRKFRENVVDYIAKGIPLENMNTKIVYQNRGDIMSDVVDGKPAVYDIRELPFVKNELNSDVENMTFYHVNKKGEIVKVGKGKVFLNTHVINDISNIKGQIFLAMGNNKGGVLPLKLNISKLNNVQADMLARIYAEIIKSSDLRKQPLGSIDLGQSAEAAALVESIQTVFEQELKLLGGDVDSVLTQSLIDFLVMEESPNSEIDEGLTSDGRGFMTFKGQSYNLESEQSINDFANALTTKARNVQTVANELSMFDLTFADKDYIKYLLDNKVLSTDTNIETPLHIKTTKEFTGSELRLDSTVYVGNSSSNTVNVKNQPDNTGGVKPTNTIEKETELKEAEAAYNEFQKLKEKSLKKQLSAEETVKMFKLTGSFMKLTPDQKHYQNLITSEKFERVSSLTGNYSSPKDIENLNTEGTLGWTAVTIGTKIDNALRDFFLNKVESAVDLREYDISADPSVLNDLFDIFKKHKENFDSKGLTVVTSNIVLYDSSKGVAGSTDIVAYDKEGNFYIYDLKTMRGDKLKTMLQGFSQFDTKYNNKLSDREKYTEQLSTYGLMMNNTFGVKPKSLHILPIPISYEQGVPLIESAMFKDIVDLKFLERLTLKKNWKSEGSFVADILELNSNEEVKPKPAKVEPKKELPLDVQQPPVEPIGSDLPGVTFNQFIEGYTEEFISKIYEHMRVNKIEAGSTFKAPVFTFNANTNTIAPSNAILDFSENNGSITILLPTPIDGKTILKPIDAGFLFQNLNKGSFETAWNNRNNSVSLASEPKIENKVVEPVVNKVVTKPLETKVEKEAKSFDENVTNADGLNYKMLEKELGSLNTKLGVLNKGLASLQEGTDKHTKTAKAVADIQSKIEKIKNDMLEIEKHCKN